MHRIYGFLLMMFLFNLSVFAGCASQQSPGPVSQEPPPPAPVLSDLDQGLKLIEEKDYAGGKAKLEEALQSEPENAEAWFRLGRVYLGYYADPQKAMQCGERAVEYDSKSAAYHEFLGECYGRMAQRSGKTLKALRFAQKSKAAFIKALELQPDNLRARRALTVYLMEAPKIAGGSWEEAETIAEETLNINDAYAYVLMASLHRKKGENEKAEELYLKALEIEPQNPSWHIELGWFYFGQKRHGEARVHFLKYQELKPHDPGATLNLGWFYVLISEFGEAEIQIERAIAMQPKYVEAWYRLGELHKRKGEEAKAQSAYEKCTALDGDNKWTGTAKARKEEKKKKKRRLKLKRADWQHYTVVGVLKSEKRTNKQGETRTVYVVEDSKGILFSLPVEGIKAEELIGKKIKVVGVGVEKTSKKGVKRVVLKEISDFEEVE